MDYHALLDNMFGLEGKVAVVTGATKGLGKTVAGMLSESGAKVALCSRNNDEAILAAKIIEERTGNKTFGMGADVSRKADVDAFISAVESELGTVDILIACAGINIRKEIPELTEDDWSAIQDINVKGSFLTAQAVLPGMREKQWGRIIFLGSMLSFISIKGRAAYSSSKAALLGLTRTFALETASEGICVNAVCPGPFKTPMNVAVYDDPEKNGEFLQKLPIGRWGDPEELRGLFLYLSSNACSYMTGSSIVIDGGWTAQ